MPVANSNPAVASAITAWFRASARDLPWRSTAGAPPGHRRDPYRTLVSEVMLQQTQVARVLERFDRFIEAFPTVADLARADEREVMGLWSGLGYYRRARLLHAAARCIAGEHGGSVPSEIAALRAIPGIGPYTAGAISSLAHGRPTPLVDGNVARVLFRIHGRDAVHADAADLRWAWGRAGELIAAAEHAGIFAPDVNEGLMELGATICTPSAPDCLSCPVRELCIARGAGRQNEIPRPKRAVVRCSLFCASILLADSKGRLLVEQRGDAGMWARLWQAPTLEATGAKDPFTRVRLERWSGVGGLKPLAEFTHQTTHRQVRFAVWKASPGAKSIRALRATNGRVWASREQIAAMGLSSPQRRILLELSR